MTNQDRKYLWNLFYSRFFMILVIQHPQSLNEQYLVELKLFFQTAPIKKIESFIDYYFNTDILNKYGEKLVFSPYHIVDSTN